MKPALAEFTGVYGLALAAVGAGAVDAATGALGHVGSALGSFLYPWLRAAVPEQNPPPANL